MATDAANAQIAAKASLVDFICSVLLPSDIRRRPRRTGV
jgi:hypothetical protein